MKKKLITIVFAAAMLAAGSMTAHAAADPALTNVTVHDWDTPAVFAAGRDWPITTWYFYDADGQVLGTIPGKAVDAIMQRDPSGNTQWEYWLAGAFNDYRDGSGITATEPTPEPPKTIPAEPPKAPSEKPEEEKGEIVIPMAPTEPNPAFDAESLALEVIELTNAEREAHGLEPLPIDDDLMELAMIRAQEVSVKYSHERPDGTRISLEYGYGENVGGKATPEKQVNSWMNSDGHRRNILLERYVSIGVGCYRADNGKTYWVQVFGTK